MTLDASDIIRLLREKLSQLQSDPAIKKFYGGTFRAWAASVDSILLRGLGKDGGRLRTRWSLTVRGLPMPNNLIPGWTEESLKFMFEQRLPEVEGVLKSIVEELETFGLPNAEPVERGERAKAFIAHAGESEALNKLCNFLDEMGVKALVVERLPSEGRSINENVEHYLDMADCAIVLATGDDLVDGKFQPRANVHIEMGRFQERFPDKIIYLLEDGASLPTNVSEKVWERFSDSNMERAYLKVLRELKAFGLLPA